MTEPGGRTEGPDLLVAGDDEPPWSLGRRRTLLLGAAVAGCALLAGGVELVSRERTAERQARAEAAAADSLEVSLGNGSTLPRHGLRPQGLHVELVNSGPRDVRLLAVEVGPDPEWEVRPDQDERLPAGGSTVLELVVPCAEDDPVGEGVGRLPVPDPMAEPPTTLELTVQLASGRTARTALDLAEAPLAYGGDLDRELPRVLSRVLPGVTAPCS